jgi:hypothetical protein
MPTKNELPSTYLKTLTNFGIFFRKEKENSVETVKYYYTTTPRYHDYAGNK